MRPGGALHVTIAALLGVVAAAGAACRDRSGRGGRRCREGATPLGTAIVLRTQLRLLLRCQRLLQALSRGQGVGCVQVAGDAQLRAYVQERQCSSLNVCFMRLSDLFHACCRFQKEKHVLTGRRRHTTAIQSRSAAAVAATVTEYRREHDLSPKP